MAFDREEFLNVVEDSYSAYYNIIKENLPQKLPMCFRADYFKREERYLLMKSARYYGNEMNEYVYLFSDVSFDRSLVDACIRFALEDGLPRVKPHKEHQFTNIKTVFLADHFEEEALKEIKNRKFRKSYGFLSLEGYSDLVTTAVDVKDEAIWTNPAGRDMKKYFTKLFSAQKKK